MRSLAHTGCMANGRQCFSPLLSSTRNFFPIVVSAHIWGPSWFRQVVLFRCDNESVVHILNSRTFTAPDVMHLLRALLMKAATHNFLLLLSTLLVLITRSLTPCLVLIGRPFISWPPMPTANLQSSLLTCGTH